jgi:hypothetical protein
MSRLSLKLVNGLAFHFAARILISAEGIADAVNVQNLDATISNALLEPPVHCGQYVAVAITLPHHNVVTYKVFAAAISVNR